MELLVKFKGDNNWYIVLGYRAGKGKTHWIITNVESGEEELYNEDEIECLKWVKDTK